MVDFSQFNLMRHYFAPTRFEADVYDCEVTGQIPDDLEGAFYRLHVDWFYPPCAPDEASLSADGYISMFRFRNGIVDYRGRYVRNERFKAQLAARRQLFGYYRNPFTDDESVRDCETPLNRTSANTTPVILKGKLYATKEDGPPFEIDPNTLETLGPDDFGGAWKSQTFTAHPKYDPTTGETIAFGYEASGLCTTDVFLGIFGPDGALRREFRFDVPYVSAIHDIAITQKHVIFPASSLVTDMERLKAGKKHWGWDRSKPSWYGIVSRETGDVRWFFGPERSIVHTANAWDTEDGKVMLDLPMANGNTWPFFEDVDGAPFQMSPNYIRRMTFDLNSNDETCDEQLLIDQEVTSFTRIDDRYLGRRHRYIFVQYSDETQPFDGWLPSDQGRTCPVNSIARFDLETDTMTSFWAGPHHLVQEPVFVPREGSESEGDGYLLATVHDVTERRAELVIVDAVAMAELARVILPFRNSMQVHGTWADKDMLPLN